MPSSDVAIEAVSQRLESFLADRRREVADSGAEAALLIDAAAAALVGGKRLRARFCIAGWRSITGGNVDDATADGTLIGAAAALEIFQAAALVHDDIVDNSDTRRGRPSAHRALEAAHVASSWAGDAAAYGRSAALLLGDLLVAWSDDLLETALVDSPRAAAARAHYARMRRDVTLGQFLDVAEEAAYLVAPEGTHAMRALRIASLKSARYSVQQPLTLGAVLAGADAGQLEALERFGHPIGLAFQLRDDVLGVFGDSAVTGKPAGDDLREGKRTLLIAYAREAAGAPERAALDDGIGAATLSGGDIERLQRIIVDTGALDRVEAQISALVAEADAALADASIATEAVAELRALGDAAVTRTA